MVLEKSSEIHYIIKNEFFQGVHIFFSYCGKSEFILLNKCVSEGVKRSLANGLGHDRKAPKNKNSTSVVQAAFTQAA